MRSHREYVSYDRMNVFIICVYSLTPPLSLSPIQTQWMMYWIVFAMFQTGEVLTDTFVAWYILQHNHSLIHHTPLPTKPLSETSQIVAN